MPLFQPASRGFAASPLSPGVPLDGTDTVTGLRQLARAAELVRVTGLLDAAGRNGKRGAGARWGANPPPPPKHHRPPFTGAPSLSSPPSITKGFAPGRRYARYKGPYLESLRPGDLQRPPRPWAEFWWGRTGQAAGGAPAQAGAAIPAAGPAAGKAARGLSPWSCPESMDAARERGEENLVYFFVSRAWGERSWP